MNHLRDALYDTFVNAFPLSRGKGRWAEFLRRLLRPRHRLLPVRVGRYSILADPADANDLLYYFAIAGKVFPTLAEKLIRPGDLVVDVGANIGFFSLCALDRVGESGRVIAFEANPKLGSRLQMEFQRQDCPIEVIQKAAWDEDTELEFFIATNSGWSSAAENASFRTRKRVRVPAVRLDAFFGERCRPSIRLLKVDVEGAELRVIQGAEDLLARRLVDFLLFETGGPQRLAAFGSTGEQLVAVLAAHGYRMVATVRNDRLQGPVANERIGCFNGDFLYASPETPIPPGLGSGAS